MPKSLVMFWDCPKCQEANSLALDRCGTCGASKPAKREKPPKIGQEIGFKGSSLEVKFLSHWHALHPNNMPVQELQFDTIPNALKRGDKGRRMWRFDFAWVKERLAIELEGGVFTQQKSGHTTGIGYSDNCEKYNAGVLGGWRILRFTALHLNSENIGNTLHIIELALEQTHE